MSRLSASLPGVSATRLATYARDPDSACAVSCSHARLLGIVAAWVGATITDSTRTTVMVATARSRRNMSNLPLAGHEHRSAPDSPTAS